ncbi:YcnI family protein [Solirubrobacter sp. CPCC 204708]|uniref:YcnI family protein n=1 Tax=Solirubrobacter deserti TaxID=2282478 RepID=A0ABT4RCJ7_9ACTN|nr:YcnI family protein [Solirubrobacter deserti]MBE2315620.1 YcnI family protein [Solirubrobacter deserti]MDA0136259.1 YcnI family protein [Solirubrobacter deserti]
MRKPIVAALAATLLVPASAHAHVTLQPSSAAAGGYTRLDVRVPNERDDASTQKVELQFPEGFESASYAPVPGWTAEVTMDGDRVSTITWTAEDEEDAIPPGAFQDFGLSLRIPEEPGAKLAFKALQTYTGGEVVRWIGAEDSDNPAPIVSVTEPTDEASHGADHSEAAATPTPAERTAATTTTDDGGNTLAVIALIVGALGLATGVAGLLAARRARA